MNDYKKIIMKINVLLENSSYQEISEYEEVLNETNTMLDTLKSLTRPDGLADMAEYKRMQHNYELLISQLKEKKHETLNHIQKLNQSQKSTVMTYLQQEEGPSLIDMDL
ncbi:hypothetical protein [Liquorilactobacillus mali]|uniref:Flagellar protein FliT n=1 Tax=Liquorilactobacillus mali KCTC 3596 = DSM 20444 TaxID=1046596 RepID=A0A0A7RFT8_9LACO|nr:hypothetical protein [Liquorilactobacillus mali]AJA34065.1 hypothetical protein [Liquorilactobacillus mali KCTC 3596 = DSM 20444]KRN11089.1 hypothetical protein FD00_GL001578 [Liquorilactobacillus mali KCTC 3596 = DSM 20444]MDV7757503.1 hypothetical protein [Liquorilactobacillus mali]QFQ75583.1 hypothetical protein LM596_11000 [Liquorilactobacillus mali]